MARVLDKQVGKKPTKTEIAMSGGKKKPSSQEGVSAVLTKAGFTRDMVERKTADILLMNARETTEFKNDEETCNFDLIVISVVEAAQRTADIARLDSLLEKVFGKTVRIEGKVDVHNTNVDVPLQQADGELIKRAIERALRNTN